MVYVRSVIEELIQKSEYVEWKNKERINHYAVVSKTGFTADAKRFAEKKWSSYLYFIPMVWDMIAIRGKGLSMGWGDRWRMQLSLVLGGYRVQPDRQ